MIRTMKNDGLSISEIARVTGADRKTVRKMLRNGSWPQDGKRGRVERPSKVDPFKPYIKARLEKYPLSAIRIYEEIVEQGYDGRLTILRDYMNGIKEEQRLLAVVRFETMPGEQSQVDWGYLGKFTEDGIERKLYAFVMVLGYSRQRFVTFTYSMDIYSLMRCHLEAFRYFDGYTREILYDNMKTVVLKPRRGDEAAKLNPAFTDFAGHYGFAVKACYPYRPQTKGKTERLVGYVKNNFYLGRNFSSLNDMKYQGIAWCDKVNRQVHGTTGKIPAEEFRKEGLLSLSGRDYDTSRRSTRTVARDCCISYGANLYSVPYQLAGKTVIVADDSDGQIRIFHQDELKAVHKVVCGKNQRVMNPEHVAELWAKVREQVKKDNARKEAVKTQPRHLKVMGRDIQSPEVEQRTPDYYEKVVA